MTNLTKPDETATVKLTEAQRAFLEFCEKFGWGKLEVTIKNGQPVLSRELVHDHKHDT